MGASDRPDLTTSTAAFGRVTYADLVTIVLTSLLATLGSVFVVTVGASILAAVETLTAVVLGEGRGGPTTERERVSVFVESYRRNLRRGLPYGVVVVTVLAAAYLYFRLSVSTGAGVFVVGTALGGYAVIIALGWVFRAASVVVRSETPPGFVDAMGEAAHLLLADLRYTSLHLLTLALVVVLTVWLRVAVVIVLPGLLAALEVVTFEEIAGERADTIVRAYRGDLA